MFRMKMWKYIIISTLFLQIHISFQNVYLKPLQQLVKDISHKLDPYQVVLFVNVSNLETFEMKCIKKYLLRDFPTRLIDLQNMSILSQISDYSILGSPRYTTLFVLLCDTDNKTSHFNFTETVDILDNYVKIFSRSIRPRWLTIITRDRAKIGKEINTLLLNAWKKKFLDFTVLEVTSDKFKFDEFIIHQYNPFYDLHETKTYSANERLFPDKIEDMNGFPLKTIFMYDPPNLYLARNASGHITSINGSDYWFLLTISQILNFTMVSDPTLVESYDDIYNQTSVIQAIINNELDFAGNQLYLWFRDQLERSMVIKSDNHCALIPNLYYSGLLLSHKFYFEVFTTFIYIFILMMVSKLAKFDKTLWNWVSLFRLILSFQIPKQPGRLKERILFACIILTSIYYSSVYYAKMTTNSLKTMNEVPFRSYKDLYKSGLVPLVYKLFYEVNFNISNKYVQELKKKAEFWVNMNTCAEEIVRNKTVACIVSATLGHAMVKKFVAHDGTPTMRLMKPCFWLSWRGFAFAPGFPYVDKFDEVQLRIIESGLNKRWRQITLQQISPLIKGNADVDKTKQRITFIFCVGNLLALLVFFVELLVNYVNSSL